MMKIRYLNQADLDLDTMQLISSVTEFGIAELNLLDESHSLLIKCLPIIDGNKQTAGDYTGRGDTSTIRVRYSSEKIMIKTIFHELQHLNQRLNGRLGEVQGQLFWDRNPHPRATNYKEYLALPWEVDARATESRLYRKWWKANTIAGNIYSWLFG